MIIDLHTRIWSAVDQLGPQTASRLRRRWGRQGSERLDASPVAHEKAMSCVDAAVVLGFRADRIGARIPNELVADFVSRDPGRRVGIAGIDPMSPEGMDQLDAALALNLAGVSVSPACQGFHPGHTEAMRLYERCAEVGLPLFVSTQEPLAAEAELLFLRPSAWDEVARAFPRMPIVIGQLGYPFVDEALALIGKHDQVYADIAGLASRRWQLYQAILSASSSGVMSKLLFASGFPAETPARAIESLYTLNAYSQGTTLPSIPRESIRAIIEQDSLRCLGIQAELTGRPGDPERDDLVWQEHRATGEPEPPLVEVGEARTPLPDRVGGSS
jgi:hypothetical protein